MLCIDGMSSSYCNVSAAPESESGPHVEVAGQTSGGGFRNYDGDGDDGGRVDSKALNPSASMPVHLKFNMLTCSSVMGVLWI